MELCLFGTGIALEVWCLSLEDKNEKLLSTSELSLNLLDQEIGNNMFKFEKIQIDNTQILVVIVVSKCKIQQSIMSSALGTSFKKDTRHTKIYAEGSAQGRGHVIWGGVKATGGIGSGKKNIWGCDQIHMSVGLPIFFFLIFKSYFTFIKQILSFGRELQRLVHDNLSEAGARLD